MTFKTALAALALACAGLASAQSRVVYDSRISTPEPRITETERGRIKALGDLAIAVKLWDTRDFKASESCDGQDFRIRGVAPGSFTEKAARQTAYLYLYCDDQYGPKQGLVIMQGDTPVAHYVFTAPFYSLYALRDINQNGYTELVLEGGFSENGTSIGSLDVAELRPQRRYLASFSVDQGREVWSSNCGALIDDAGWKSLVIRVTPGPSPKFTAQAIAGQCDNERAATSSGPVRPITVKPAATGWTPAPLR